MPQRTNTAHLTNFTRPPPSAVTYDLSTPNSVLITVPAGSTWSSDLHWHETHTEYLQILKGRALVTLGNWTGEVGMESGVLTVERGVVHCWKRVPDRKGAGVGGANTTGNEVDRAVDEEDGELVVREWTDPVDGQKEIFFRMLNSCLMESRPGTMYDSTLLRVMGLSWVVERYVVTLQLFIIFREWDNWPVFVGTGGRHWAGWLTWSVAHLVLGMATLIGWVIGLKGRYGEYVGPELGERVRIQSKKGKRA